MGFLIVHNKEEKYVKKLMLSYIYFFMKFFLHIDKISNSKSPISVFVERYLKILDDMTSTSTN